jgi:hypothetical protein
MRCVVKCNDLLRMASLSRRTIGFFCNFMGVGGRVTQGLIDLQPLTLKRKLIRDLRAAPPLLSGAAAAVMETKLRKVALRNPEQQKWPRISHTHGPLARTGMRVGLPSGGEAGRT